MKKIYVIIWVILIIIALIMSIIPVIVYADNILYPTCGIITEIKDNIVTFTDFNGNMWSFYGAEDWEINDICAVIMDNNGTETIYDDIITSIRYCGWVN